MNIYETYCRETLDDAGRLTDIQIHYPPNFNFGYDVVDATADLDPEKRALVWCNTEGEEQIFTFRQISRLSNQAANVFRAAGVGRGDHVIVALKRHYEYWYVSIALHKLGAVMVPVTHMLTTQDIVYRMRSLNLKAIVCTPQNDVPQRMVEALEATGLCCPRFTVQQAVPGFVNLTEAITSAPEELPRQETAAHDPMFLYFTSGTTGYPKGVIHDFTYPLAHSVTAKYWQQAEDNGLHFTVAETGWAKASWGKLYGQWLVGSAVMVFDFDNFDPKQLITVINQYGVTSFCAPPTVYRYLTRKGIPPMPSLRHASTAGEQLNPEVSRRFTERTGLPLNEGYGQTETTLLLANFKGNPPVTGSLGTPSPLYRVELQCADGTHPAPGEIGEIVILPPENGRQIGLFIGYLGNDALYENAWASGVYHTGDAAWQDENGCFWFHGRFDDLIKTGGFRVGPYEVENVLMEHAGVLECAVVGVPDPLRTGVWFKTPENANITIDLWCGNGKRTHGDGMMKPGHQMANMCGGRLMQPNLRNVPFVIDPFAFKQVDAVLATHYHQDHMSAEWAAHVIQSGMTTTDENGNVIPVPFIGPKKSVETWVKWGVPEDRCITVKPGDVIKIKDLEIVALDSFDRTCIVTTDDTSENREELTGVCPTDMDDKAVNYLVKTPGGNIYHSGDSHFSIYFAKHGKDYDIDVAFGSFGENPIGMQDKMSSIDVLRMAENLQCKVVVPIHWDVWTNFQADCEEIRLLYDFKKDRNEYKFHPFFWQVGGKYTYPMDKDKMYYHHRRGFEDCFEHPQNIPYRSCL